jgi:hypothetical protein
MWPPAGAGVGSELLELLEFGPELHLFFEYIRELEPELGGLGLDLGEA